MSKDVFKIFTRKLSSYTLFEHDMHLRKGLYNRFNHYMKTKAALQEIKANFPDFKKFLLVEDTIDNYYSINEAIKTEDYVQLMKVLSFPLFETVEKSIKTNNPLTFTLHDEISKCDLVGARVVKNEITKPKPYNIWYQVSFNFVIKDNKGFKDQLVVVERRQIDEDKNDWRICSISN